MQNVLVTGVSTGIGWGTAKILISKGMHVFGSVRKQSDAGKLVQEFGAALTPVLFDITDEPAVHAGADFVREQLAGDTLCGLVNNAGIAVFGPLLHQPIADFRKQIDVNLTGSLIVTQSFAPLLGARSNFTGTPGRIVMVSSVGGKMGSPFLGAYVASKHALEGLAESLRRELILYGIDVIIVGPGEVATPIWDKAEQSDVSMYEHTDYAASLTHFGDVALAEGRKGFPPERIGEVIYTALTTAQPRVRYAIVPNAITNWFLPNLLPRRIIDNLLARSYGLTRARGK